MRKSIFRLFTHKCIITLTLLMAATGAMGQDDLSGTYFIRSYGSVKNPDKGDPNVHAYYLCPAEGYCFYVADNTITNTDNGKPFLTTYKCRDGVYDVSKAVWILQKESESGCYYIIQKKTGRYLMSNGSMSGNADRLRVHLEEVDPSTLDDKALFEITFADGYMNIQPHSTYGRNGSNTYLVVNNGNYNQLDAGYKTGGPSGYENYTGGIIGLWLKDNKDYNERFKLEDYILTPTITNSNNQIEIAYPSDANAVIYYTTDGSRPTTESAQYSGPFDPGNNVTTIKAIAVTNGETTNVATLTPPFFCGSHHPVLIQNQNNAWASGEHQGNHFYMIPGDNNKVNTTSVFRPSMQWYFLNAGIESDTQYYYVVNNSTGKYLSYDSDVIMQDFDSGNSNKFKFSLTTAANNSYHLIPYGQTQFVNKANSNNNNAVLGLTGSDGLNNRWKFVSKNTLNTTAPFSLDKNYKIRCNGNDDEYYITAPATAGGDATVSNETGIDDRMSWFFELAQAANDNDWLDYYYIRNATTGEYLYYTKDPAVPSNNNKAFITRNTIESGNEARYMFTWARAADVDRYFIIPQLLKDESQNNVSTLNRSNTDLRVQRVRGTGTSAWWFNEITPQYPEPTVEFDNTTGKVSFSSIFDGASFYYTTDGTTTPTVNETYKYDGAFTISDETTIKVIATKSVYTPSEVVTQTISKVATPTTEFTSNGRVRIVCSTPDVIIYYTLDGSTPSTSSTRYTSPLVNISGKTVKAIAVKDGWITSDVGGSTGPITLQCGTPVIRRGANNTFTIECEFPTEGVTIYYTTDGTDPTTSSNSYTQAVSTTFPVTVKAIAVADGYDNSEIATKTIAEGLDNEDGYYLISSSADFDLFVSMVNSDGASQKYKVTDDFSVSNSAAVTNRFKGSFDGGFHIISGLRKPLFIYAEDATIKNVILDNVTVNRTESGQHAGAIVCVAEKSCRIYNCGILSTNGSSSITSTQGNAGGIAGRISNDSRVVNCYNYATITGGTYAGGIVGKNNGTYVNDILTSTTRIAMGMMYGDLSGGNEESSPVYAGTHVSNVKNYTEYNFWRIRGNVSYSKYNDQLAIDKDEFLTRFPFYRHILNTHRELAAFFLFGTSTQSAKDMTAEQISEIGHWTLKPEIAPYPIIEAWETGTKKTTEDIASNLPLTTEDYKGRQLTEMGNSGFLTVNVTINGSTYSSLLPITDMNEDRFDYTWGKVVLPFADEYNGWTRDYSKVCTGWKITNVGNGTVGTYANYNMADRDCTAKDLYSNTGYIFAQGGNYVVPYGVTSINIEANFANAFYLSDPAYEIGYDDSFNNPTNLGGSVPVSYHGQTVYTNLSTLAGQLATTNNPHDQAIVLVGNYHYRITTNNFYLNTGKAVTIMSCDEDNNQEPDYGWYMANTYGRLEVPALRFDFVPIIEMGMSQRPTGSGMYPGIGIWHARGWFELTETCVSYMSQCEINSSDFTNADSNGNNRWIANSGYFIQIVRAKDGACTKLSYIQIGGNAYVKELYPGCHTDVAYTNTIVPINVSGGEIAECYMSGYKSGGKLSGDMIRFWCTGGKIHKWLGAYMDEPQTAGLSAKIDHALIGRFFGGGTSAAARIKGDIDITINNSKVDFYCGGPEFGDMNAGKNVTTHATNTIFGEYYGGGFGGTSITYNREKQNDNVNISTNATTPYDLAFTYYTNQRLKNKANYGIGTCYKFEYIYHSKGSQGVSRFYTGYAQFSLATTGNVTNELNGCTILGDFYGAGCQGKVNGSVTSTLTDCIVNGSAYGGGYKAESNEVDVYPITQPTYSVYTKETGVFSDFGTVAPEIYTWEQGTAGTANEGSKKLYTDVVMSDLGNVIGAITITIDGGSVGKNVFGGGNESKSLNNAKVIIEKGTISEDIFGGGNLAIVGENAEVEIKGGNMRDVYGGGALANTNTSSGNTLVNLLGGAVRNVYGGGLGDSGTAAIVGGDVTVTLDGSVVKGNIFGCNNINGTPQGHVKVWVKKTVGWAGHDVSEGKADDTIEKNTGVYEVAAVYGGGNLAPYQPTSDSDYAEVVIDGCDLTSIQYVYGGGNAASVPATSVTVNGDYEIEYLFGGGNGKDDLPNGDPNPGADVGYLGGTAYGTGKTQVNVLGGTIHHVFGSSNTLGNVRTESLVFLDESGLCPLILDEIYGGGNEAAMDGSSKIKLGCITHLKELYGGSKAADVGGDIDLTITSGHFDRVFGGNNVSGTINGFIRINIEETGCKPITIGEIYGCGNAAAYTTPAGKSDPTINIRSFTSIGRVFGGGLGEGAIVNGNPHVNINEVVGNNATTASTYAGKTITLSDGTTVALPTHESGKMGAIGTVFGGGNAAKVIGNTYVNVGTENQVIFVTPETETVANRTKTVDGADIRQNVYGGGNAADVTGDTFVVIGK